MFNNLIELMRSIPDEKACREYLIKERWNGVIVCPYCKKEGAYVIEGGKRFKCKSNECYKKFSVTVGTVMEASNIPLTKWVIGMYLVSSSKKPISSYNLAGHIGIAQRHAWFMLHRIREMLKCKEQALLGLNNPVEIDETLVGGSITNKHNKVRKDYAINPEKYPKTIVLGMVERGGNFIAKTITAGEPYEIIATVADNIKKDSTLITDTTNLYNKLNNDYDHHSVNHSINEYGRGEIHTNTIEGAFSHFKITILGIYHQVSPKHLQRYCDEFAYRYNTKQMSHKQRFENSLKGMEGRLTYKNLISNVIIQISLEQKKINKKNGIVQMTKEGEIIAHFGSPTKAALKTGIDRGDISKTCRGIKKSAGGYLWIYA